MITNKLMRKTVPGYLITTHSLWYGGTVVRSEHP